MNQILTHEDRAAHVKVCQARDKEQGMILPVEYYARLGDQASVNAWYYHDPASGHNRLYANTPDWIVELARKMRWISDKGVLSASKSNAVSGRFPKPNK